MLKNKDIISMQDLTKDEINEILHTARFMKNIVVSGNKKAPNLQGKSVITLFYENSTRTRMSFELASKYLSSASANIAASSSSVAKGETLIDTGKTLDMMGTDIIIIRHPMSGAPALLSKHVKASVINAGDGMNEHPSQALLDMFTILEHKESLEGLKVAIIGDVYHSRVARSNMWGLTKMGAKVVFASPPTLMPLQMENTLDGVEVTFDVAEAVRDADVVMCLRIQKERQHAGLFPSVREYADIFGIDNKKLALAKKDAIVMHPGPMNRGTEISSFTADGPQSVITQQVQSGVAVRMAMLHLLSRREV